MAKPRLLYIGNKLSSFGYTPTGIEFLGDLLAREGYQVIYGGERQSQWRRSVHMLQATINFNGYDVMLIDVYSTRAFYFALAAGLMAYALGKPYILILRGGGLPERLDRSPKMMRVILSKAARVVSVSRYLQQVFGSLRTIEFIPNAIPINDYEFKLRREFRPRLLWVRSLHVTYNPELAVRLVSLLTEKYPDVELLMIGPDKDGSEEKVRRLASELGVSPFVSLTGKLSKKEWTKLASEYDIFINTTNYDNMPVSVVEGMALGLPIVSTRVGGIPYLITDRLTGLLVPPNDQDNFLSAVCEIVENPVLGMALSKEGRMLAEQFDEQVVAQLWISLLSDYESV